MMMTVGDLREKIKDVDPSLPVFIDSKYNSELVYASDAKIQNIDELIYTIINKTEGKVVNKHWVPHPAFCLICK